jgi:hypothetical protein
LSHEGWVGVPGVVCGVSGGCFVEGERDTLGEIIWSSSGQDGGASFFFVDVDRFQIFFK